MPITKQQIEDEVTKAQQKIDDTLKAVTAKLDAINAEFDAGLDQVEQFLTRNSGKGYTVGEVATEVGKSVSSTSFNLGILDMQKRVHVVLHHPTGVSLPQMFYFAGPAPAR
jgi:hypothetical protein